MYGTDGSHDAVFADEPRRRVKAGGGSAAHDPLGAPPPAVRVALGGGKKREKGTFFKPKYGQFKPLCSQLKPRGCVLNNIFCLLGFFGAFAIYH